MLMRIGLAPDPLERAIARKKMEEKAQKRFKPRFIGTIIPDRDSYIFDEMDDEEDDESVGMLMRIGLAPDPRRPHRKL